MWKQYPIAKTIMGLSAVVVLALCASSQRSTADGSNGDHEYECEQCPSCKPAPQVQANVVQPIPNAGVAPPANFNAPNFPNQPPVPVGAIQNPPHPYASPARGRLPQFPTAATPATRTARTASQALPALVSAPASAGRNQTTKAGLPSGVWVNETIMGDVTMTIEGNKLCIQFEGKGELAAFQPTLRGEYSVASDGTIFGLIHSADFGSAMGGAQEFSEGYFLLSGLSDIPFSMRIYSQADVLAVKNVTLGIPMQAMMASDGEFSEMLVYAQSVLTGQYQPSR